MSGSHYPKERWFLPLPQQVQFAVLLNIKSSYSFVYISTRISGATLSSSAIVWPLKWGFWMNIEKVISVQLTLRAVQ